MTRFSTSRAAGGERSACTSPLEIELLTSADDADAKRTDRELVTFRHVRGVVESHAAPVDKCHSAVPHHRPDLAPDDERGVLVDAESHQRRKLGHGHEETIQSATLSKVSVDESVITEETETRANVLFDQLSLFIHFVSCERRFGQRCGTRARPTNDRAVDERIPDCFLQRRAAQRRDQLHLITAADEDSARIAHLFDDLLIRRVVAILDQRNGYVGRAGLPEIGEPHVSRYANLARRSREADDGSVFFCARHLDEAADRRTRRSRTASDEDESASGVA